jgi:pSer/pThr/pTyr-binding forkhead associated (FHA) protein
MNDPRLNSGHFESLGRRQDYRRARELLLGARGWMTLATERIHDMVEDSDNWPALLPIRPDQVLPGAKFVLIDQQTRQTYALHTGLNTIGRFPENDIVLEVITVSRRHCALLVHARGVCELHDTASRNGTFVNGQVIRQPVRLHSGDRIQIGPVELLFVAEKDCPPDERDPDYPDTAILE